MKVADKLYKYPDKTARETNIIIPKSFFLISRIAPVKNGIPPYIMTIEANIETIIPFPLKSKEKKILG